MDLVLIPSEVKSAAKKIMADMESVSKAVSSTYNTIIDYSNNDRLKSRAWERNKNVSVEVHSAINALFEILGRMTSEEACKVYDSITEKDNLYESQLRLQIDALRHEIENIYKTMDTIRLLSQHNIYIDCTKLFRYYMNNIELIEEEIARLENKIEYLNRVNESTSELLTEIPYLLSKVDSVICEAVDVMSIGGSLSAEPLSRVVYDALETVVEIDLNHRLEQILEIDAIDFKEIYGTDKYNTIKEKMIEKQLTTGKYNESAFISMVIETASECDVRVISRDNTMYYRVRAGNSSVSREYTMETTIDTLKNNEWERSQIIIPNKIEYTHGGDVDIFYPFENWEIEGRGAYNGKPMKDSTDTYYRIAVAPRIRDPFYPDDGRVLADDFKNCSEYINLILEDKKTGEEKTLYCIVSDMKPHSINRYIDEQGHEIASFNVENGIVQTGICYKYAAGNHKELVLDTASGIPIEFCTDRVDFSIDAYRLKEIVIVEK